MVHLRGSRYDCNAVISTRYIHLLVVRFIYYFCWPVCGAQHTALLDEHSRLSSAHAAVQQELAAERQSAETLRTSSVDASTLAEAQALLANSQQQLRAAADELRVLKDTQRREVSCVHCITVMISLTCSAST